MYRLQVFTFGFLLSSLVMLVLVPFLNNNSFLSNPAMAQEYDKYGDSSYSQIPTDDKKYECRTGPFEGFFVSSVEFCKHGKFDKDDRKDRDTKQEHKVRQVQQVQQVHQDHKVLQDLMEQQEQQVHKANKGFKVYKVL